MGIVTVVPSIHEEFSHQTKLSDVTDEEFRDYIAPPKFSFHHRLYQILCFFIFLGPIRLLVGLIGFSFSLLIVYIIRVLIKVLGVYPDAGKSICVQILRIGFRILFFSFGAVWINVNGKIDPEARFVISNHVSLLDSYVILILRSVTFVIKKDYAKNNFLHTIFEIFDPLYVEKVNSGAQKGIIDSADDTSRYPVLLFPEATTTNGEALLQFQKGAFLTPYKVQPMLIRYSMLFVPKGWNTVSYTNQSLLEFFWQLLCIPACIINVDSIQSISMEAEGKADIDTFTVNAQIIFANHLKTKAISRSKSDIEKQVTIKPMSLKKKTQ
ncbi:Acyltransferase family protein [Tritrichomonas foetus]|uniref:Acyltransferase family protein n=1 Tax=Tritrichomonas foetus TaxID=1144522 RepID=A0A1J4JIA8_9EUKA|nr:Acyltransferase family protein [Tritrichomonas foetus]|eukprot:OHS98870.1 Acyltransferase family protein [Tritrichomonas foetus]